MTIAHLEYPTLTCSSHCIYVAIGCAECFTWAREASLCSITLQDMLPCMRTDASAAAAAAMHQRLASLLTAAPGRKGCKDIIASMAVMLLALGACWHQVHAQIKNREQSMRCSC